MLAESEFILNPDGSIYHLNLLPRDIAQNIILVGDPERVPKVSKHFDSIEIKKQKREFVTHTGLLNHKRISVISTGIGTPNIDIVFNELDALVNIDFETKEFKQNHTSLNFIRIGTCGSIQENIPVDSFLISESAIGFDGLLNYYDYKEVEDLFFNDVVKEFKEYNFNQMFYNTQSSKELVDIFSEIGVKGKTATLPGFYAPQGRALRLHPKAKNFLDRINKVGFQNFEMETAGIYGLASLMNHRAISLNAILANRQNGTFSKQPKQTIERLIEKAIHIISRDL